MPCAPRVAAGSVTVDPAAATDALVAPRAGGVGDGDRRRAYQRLLGGIATRARAVPGDDLLVVTLSSLRAARHSPAGAHPTPFAWSPLFVRRSLGLAAIRACLAGRWPTPAEAMTGVVDEAVAEWRRTGWRTFHWEPWVAGLPPGARAAVVAEAVTWAADLWLSLDWRRIGRVVVGGAAEQWTCPGERPVRLKARVDLRVPIGPGDRGGSTLVAVSSGLPAEGWQIDLGYLALVAGLRAPSRPVPPRVVGLWPDAGELRCLDVDGPSLTGAVDGVLTAVTASTSPPALADPEPSNASAEPGCVLAGEPGVEGRSFDPDVVTR